VAAERQTAHCTASLSWLLGALLTIGSAAGCWEDDANQKTGSRDGVSRDLPTMTALETWDPDVTLDAGLVDDLFTNYEAGPCCDVAFALRAQDDELSAILMGSAPPLEGSGVLMTLDDGVWRATVCIPADYMGFYYYEVYLAAEAADGGPPPDGGTAFAAQRINPSAPEGTDDFAGTVNTFPPLTHCDDPSADLHSTLP
jgi:hypothetical protein